MSQFRDGNKSPPELIIVWGALCINMQCSTPCTHHTQWNDRSIMWFRGQRRLVEWRTARRELGTCATSRAGIALCIATSERVGLLKSARPSAFPEENAGHAPQDVDGVKVV